MTPRPQQHCENEEFCWDYVTRRMNDIPEGWGCPYPCKHDTRSRPIQPPCPYWGIEHSDGMEWVCSKPAPSPSTCTWKENEEYGMYETGCGNAFQTIEGDIEENNFKFCPYCGGKIREAPR